MTYNEDDLLKEGDQDLTPPKEYVDDDLLQLIKKFQREGTLEKKQITRDLWLTAEQARAMGYDTQQDVLLSRKAPEEALSFKQQTTTGLADVSLPSVKSSIPPSVGAGTQEVVALGIPAPQYPQRGAGGEVLSPQMFVPPAVKQAAQTVDQLESGATVPTPEQIAYVTRIESLFAKVTGKQEDIRAIESNYKTLDLLVGALKKQGRTPDTEALLKEVYGATDKDISDILGTARPILGIKSQPVQVGLGTIGAKVSQTAEQRATLLKNLGMRDDPGDKVAKYVETTNEKIGDAV